MTDNWKTYTLGEVLEIKYGKDHKLLSDGDIPVYGSGGIMRYANKALYDQPTILIPRKGTLSNLFFIEHPFWSVDTMFYTKIREGNNPKFIYYYLKTLNLAALNVGSAVPSLTTEVLNKVEIQLPSIDFQNQIVTILSSLDYKIELNNQMNQTLEAMAQAIFKEWFVDFKFPGFDGELVDGLPKGWRLGNLTDLVETVSKTFKFSEHQNVIFLNTSDILDGEFLNSTLVPSKGLPGQAKKTILKGDILFSEIRPANKRYAYVNFDSEDYVVSTKLMVLRSKGIFDNIITYYILKSSDVLKELQSLAESRSGTFPQITYTELSKISVNIPTEEVIDKFTVILQNVNEKMSRNVIEIRTLTDLRDSLLPKLMNGKIKTNQ